ncbi:hypothetical protein [Clostridium sp. D53t1_180928_C8]|uniref:hypothetical protein n=1 Tax=Clostridium sp. D53t1_180928_C8 TaxID=2787101 RepID=UPI0018A919F3|nr:hypothetical protein [Clostridium sp. D53t1_180928_C8]
MIILEKQMKLANEAVELIKEFREEAAILGTNPLKAISIKENGEVIEVDDEFEGIKEYSLSEISSIFQAEMRGWGPCSAGFYEAISLAEADLEYDFKRYSKEEFKEYAGNLKYAEFRCEAIYERLEEIEKEVSE